MTLWTVAGIFAVIIIVGTLAVMIDNAVKHTWKVAREERRRVYRQQQQLLEMRRW